MAGDIAGRGKLGRDLAWRRRERAELLAAAREAAEGAAAPLIQAAWKGHLIRRRIRDAQEAAK
eukprot:1196115-Prorocentrum_minimum.AAC.2